jgi:hypothetical protein
MASQGPGKAGGRGGGNPDSPAGDGPPTGSGYDGDSPPTAGGSGGDGGSDSVRKFLVSLATDPARLGAFIKDPDAELEAAGLSEQDRAALKSGNPAAIYGLVSGQQASPSGGAQDQPPIIVLIIDAEKGAEGGEPKLRVRTADIPMMPPNMPLILVFAGQAGAQQAGGFPMVMPQMMIMPQIYSQIFGPQPQFPPMIFHPQQFPPMVLHQQPGGFPVFPQVLPMILVIAAEAQGAAAAPSQAPAPAQITPQLVQPQIQLHPQLVFQQITPLQIHPLQIFPQVHPQIFPQVHPQIFPQVHPQVFPQVHPLQIFPQVHPQIFPQVHPQVFPQIHPLQIQPLQIFPQVHPQIFPQIQQLFPMIFQR